MEILIRGKNLVRFVQLFLLANVLIIGAGSSKELSKEDQEIIKRLEFLATLELLETEIRPKTFLKMKELKGKKKTKRNKKINKRKKQGNQR